MHDIQGKFGDPLIKLEVCGRQSSSIEQKITLAIRYWYFIETGLITRHAHAQFSTYHTIRTPERAQSRQKLMLPVPCSPNSSQSNISVVLIEFHRLDKTANQLIFSCYSLLANLDQATINPSMVILSAHQNLRTVTSYSGS